MGAGVGSENILGLPGDHAYTLLGAYIVTDSNKTTHRLIKLRNPWGFDVYNGTWNDASSKWTQAIKQ